MRRIGPPLPRVAQGPGEASWRDNPRLPSSSCSCSSWPGSSCSRSCEQRHLRARRQEATSRGDDRPEQARRRLRRGPRGARTTNAPTTVKEYKFVPAQTLPPVKGTSKPTRRSDANGRRRCASRSTSGPAGRRSSRPTAASSPARSGRPRTASPSRSSSCSWTTPSQMRDAYAQRRGAHRLGDARHGAALHGGFRRPRPASRKDSRVMPRIYQQVDWSNGGDGIVARANIKTVGRPAQQEDRAGPELPVALLRAEHARLGRRAAGRGRRGVFTADAFQAAAAFNSDKSLAAAA